LGVSGAGHKALEDRFADVFQDVLSPGPDSVLYFEAVRGPVGQFVRGPEPSRHEKRVFALKSQFFVEFSETGIGGAKGVRGSGVSVSAPVAVEYHPELLRDQTPMQAGMPLDRPIEDGH
jgi:hypothetical protein